MRSTNLAAVLASLLVSSADENVRNVFSEPCLLIHGLTLSIVDDGQINLLKNCWQWSICNLNIKISLRIACESTFI